MATSWRLYSVKRFEGRGREYLLLLLGYFILFQIQIDLADSEILGLTNMLRKTLQFVLLRTHRARGQSERDARQTREENLTWNSDYNDNKSTGIDWVVSYKDSLAPLHNLLFAFNDQRYTYKDNL